MSYIQAVKGGIPVKLSKGDKNRQINKEALISIILYLFYFIWWYVTGFIMGNTDPSNYKFYFGLPIWFILNSIVGPLIFIVAVIFTVKCFFKDFDLETEEEENK